MSSGNLPWLLSAWKYFLVPSDSVKVVRKLRPWLYVDPWPLQTLVGGQRFSQGLQSLDRRPEAEHGQHPAHKLRQPPVCREREQREREQRLDAFQERREKARLQRERLQLQCQRQRLERERLERERLERERMRVERERRKEQQRIMREREELRRQQEQLRAEQERRALRRPYGLDARWVPIPVLPPSLVNKHAVVFLGQHFVLPSHSAWYLVRVGCERPWKRARLLVLSHLDSHCRHTEEPCNSRPFCTIPGERPAGRGMGSSIVLMQVLLTVSS